MVVVVLLVGDIGVGYYGVEVLGLGWCEYVYEVVVVLVGEVEVMVVYW